MSRYVALCAVCGQLGPYGFYRREPDGSDGRAWACEAHREEVRAKVRADTSQVSETPVKESVP